jgi:hypothetical protein
MSPPPPGWYPDVERPGGERYWDGFSWTDDRRAAPGPPGPAGFAGPPPPLGQPPFGQPPFGQPPFGQPQFGAPAGYQPYGAFGTTYTKSSKSGVSLALSISSIFGAFCCGLGVFLAIPGAIIGWQEMKAIDRGEIDPSGRGAAKAGFIIGTTVAGLTAALFVLYVVALAVSSA